MKYIYLIAFLLLISQSSFAQVFPGDANNDGIVNHHDILNIGYAFGTVGPARIDIGVSTTEQEVAVFWDETFPGGLNFAHADANGDGLVGWEDLLAIFINYEEENGALSFIEYEEGIEGVDIPIYFDLSGQDSPLTEGSVLSIPLYIGTEDIPLVDFHGLAFSIEYNSDFIASADLFLNSGWLSDQELFEFQGPLITDVPGNDEANRLDIALTHFGADFTGNGFGQIGTFSIVIEDNLVGLLPVRDSADVYLSIRDVALFDQNFEPVPVVRDSASLMIYHPDALSVTNDKTIDETLLNIFPNPTSSLLHLQYGKSLDRIEIYSIYGKRLWQETINGQNNVTINLQQIGLSAGTYLINIYSEGSRLQKKIVCTN
jgi:hypothetical protein